MIGVLLISILFFTPQQSFGEYYTGRCPDVGWTESEARNKVIALEGIFGINIKGYPDVLNEILPIPRPGDFQEYVNAKNCLTYFDPENPLSVPIIPPSPHLCFDEYGCPNVGCSENNAKALQKEYQRIIEKYKMDVGKYGAFDISLDRAENNLKNFNVCVEYFEKREGDIETLKELVPEEIRKPFEEDKKLQEPLKEIYDEECLIATASFDSRLSPEVQMLREIRDNQLLQTESGSTFMSAFNSIYYIFSPTIANWENENPAFKEVVKITITPLISTLSLLNYVTMNSEAEVLGYGISLILLNIGMYFGVPVFTIIGIKKKF